MQVYKLYNHTMVLQTETKLQLECPPLAAQCAWCVVSTGGWTQHRAMIYLLQPPPSTVHILTRGELKECLLAHCSVLSAELHYYLPRSREF